MKQNSGPVAGAIRCEELVMPRTHYPEVITESVDELLAAERALGSQRA